jgi:hypothetical protein
MQITVLVRSTVGGPDGVKLRPGQVVTLEDSDYVRILLKSDTVELIDPPSLDNEFLAKAGYLKGETASRKAKKVSKENLEDSKESITPLQTEAIQPSQPGSPGTEPNEIAGM